MDTMIRLSVVDGSDGRQIASVGLKEYKAMSKNPLQRDKTQRLIWSFAILADTDQILKLAWATQQPIRLRTEVGHVATAHVVALPANIGGFGLFEFLTSKESVIDET